MLRDFLKRIVMKILEWEARLILRRFKPKIVAVTGNIGKTGTKDAIATVLEGFTHVRKSEKSFNNEFGIPLTIIGVGTGWGSARRWLDIILEGFYVFLFPQNYPKWLVLEVGADRPGDIEDVTKWLHPDIAVVTSLGTVPVHVEFFESPEALAQEKAYLPKSVKRGGVAILNYDDPKVRDMAASAKVNVLMYGFDSGATFRASNDHILYDDNAKPNGVTFRVDYDGHSVPIRLFGVVGKSHCYNMLAALAVGVSQDRNLISLAEAVHNHAPTPGRLRLLSGIKETTIIDDTYNSSPAATAMALDTLSQIETKGRKIAVLGDMLELGIYTKEEHEKVGVRAVGVVDRLFLVGPRAEFIGAAALENGFQEDNLFYFNDASECGKYLQQYIEPADVILLKGSQGIHLERAVLEIMAHPEKRKELLVRQEDEWGSK